VALKLSPKEAEELMRRNRKTERKHTLRLDAVCNDDALTQDMYSRLMRSLSKGPKGSNSGEDYEVVYREIKTSAEYIESKKAIKVLEKTP
jgi:hypothetical protein